MGIVAYYRLARCKDIQASDENNTATFQEAVCTAGCMAIILGEFEVVEVAKD